MSIILVYTSRPRSFVGISGIKSSIVPEARQDIQACFSEQPAASAQQSWPLYHQGTMRRGQTPLELRSTAQMPLQMHAIA